MSHGEPYFVWRDGRPRWEPGPTIRAKGFRGVDLKDDQGAWLDFDRARAAARSLNAHVQTRNGEGKLIERTFQPRMSKAPTRDAFIYFLCVGHAVKIGYTTDPARRIADIRTYLPDEIAGLAVVRGGRAEEQRLHRALRPHRIRGEWFKNCPDVQAVVCQSLLRGRLALEELEAHYSRLATDRPGYEAAKSL